RPAGGASRINTSGSRAAGLLAVALLGVLRGAIFQAALDRRLDRFALSPAARAQIDAQGNRLAAAEVSDPRVRQAIEESFVAGYRTILWAAAGLAIARSLTAAALIHGGSRRNTATVATPPSP